MTKQILLILTFLSFSISSSIAEQVITLKDGSQIKGDVTGIENGTYTVKTPTLGDVKVETKNIASITNPGVSVASRTPSLTAPISGSDFNREMQARQEQLMKNPEAMMGLQELLKDPEIMQALSDPELVKAVTNHDYQAMQSNSRIKDLVNNPKMRALMDRLRAQQASTQ